MNTLGPKVIDGQDWLFHICTSNAADEAKQQGLYHPSSLDFEGFIHLSFKDQVAGVYERYFTPDQDLVLLTLDRNQLSAPLKIEAAQAPATKANLSRGGQRGGLFPHLYGPLNYSAVVDQTSITSETFKAEF